MTRKGNFFSVSLAYLGSLHLEQLNPTITKRYCGINDTVKCSQRAVSPKRGSQEGVPRKGYHVTI